jgi:hypothetical protein
MAMAECAQPALEPDDLAYTSEVITPHLEARDQPTWPVCLAMRPPAFWAIPARSERARRSGSGLAPGSLWPIAPGYPLTVPGEQPDDRC